MFVKTCHAKTLWVVDLLGEDGGAVELVDGGREFVTKAFTKENIVAQNQTHIVALQPFLCNQEGIGNAARFLLHKISDVQAQTAAIAKQALE